MHLPSVNTHVLYTFTLLIFYAYGLNTEMPTIWFCTNMARSYTLDLYQL